MADVGYLVPPSQDPTKQEMWTETRKRLGRFLPDLFVEIFPDTGKEAENLSSASAVASPAQQSTDSVAKRSEDTAVSPSPAKEGATDGEKVESEPNAEEAAQ